MKKYVLMVLLVLSIAIMPIVHVSALELPEVTDHEVVKVYLFYKSDCSHCHAFIEYFADIYADYSDYFEIVTYQIDSTDNNYADYTLSAAVAEEVGEESGYVPLIVIGDDYHKLGFGTDGTEIIEAALEAYQDDDYVDLVAEVVEDTDSEAVAKTFLDACEVTGISCSGSTSTEGGLSDGAIIGIIFVVIIVIFGGLVVFSRKKN